MDPVLYLSTSMLATPLMRMLKAGSGIETYEWRVLFDAPYNGDTNFDLGTYIQESSASNGQWAYRFSNVT